MISGGMIALAPYFVYKNIGSIVAIIFVFAAIRFFEFFLYSLLSFVELKKIDLNEPVHWSYVKKYFKIWSLEQFNKSCRSFNGRRVFR